MGGTYTFLAQGSVLIDGMSCSMGRTDVCLEIMPKSESNRSLTTPNSSWFDSQIAFVTSADESVATLISRCS